MKLAPLPILSLPALALGFATLLAPRYAAAHPVQEAIQAPPGAWVTQGGSPARARSVATAPLRRAPSLAWRFEASGALVGEPLAWGNSIVVELDRGAQRALVLLDRASGRQVGSELTFRTTLPLAPALWGDAVLVRAEERRLEALRIGPRGLGRSWRWRSEGALGEPLLVERTAFVVAGASLVAIELGSRAPRWSREGGFFGPLAAATRSLAALAPGPGGRGWRIVHLEPESGERLGELAVWPDATTLGDPRRAGLALVAGRVLVRPERPFPLPEGPSPSLAVSALWNADTGLESLGIGHQSPAAGWSQQLLARLRFGEHDYWLLTVGRDGAFKPLASKELHAHLLDHGAAPSIASGVAYVAGMAVELESLQVLWRGAMPGPMLPIADGVLHLAPDGALEGWLAREASPDVAFDAGSFPAAALGWEAEDGAAILADGVPVSGPLAIGGEQGALLLQRTRGRRVESWPLEQVRALRDGEDRLVWSSGRRALLEAIALEVEESAAETVRELARRALRRREPTGLEAVLRATLRWRGEDEALVQSLETELARSSGARAPRNPPAVDEELLPALAALETLEAERLWQTFEALPEAAREVFAFPVLERVLELAPEFRPAWSWIAARAPVEAIASPRDAREWSEYLAVARDIPLTVHRPPGADRAGLGHAERQLGRAVTRWRPDLVGFRSPRLLVITSVARPGVLARVIAHGELLCLALEELFAFGEHDRSDRFPLEIRLYDSQEEYLAQSADGVLAHANLTWTAGHFSEHERVSRLFVPDGADGFEQAEKTFLHELTHHWLHERCPAFTLEERLAAGPATPGYWIVEGFACLAEGLELDVQRGTWRFGATVGERLDLAAHIPPGEALDWRRLFRAAHAQVPAMVGKGRVPVALGRRLGAYVEMDRTGLFYAQSAAAARYLFEAEDGAQRRALLEYLIAWYRGERAGTDVQRAFGLEPRELGERIGAWSRERVRAPD